MCRDPEDQFEAIVSVRLHEGDLICNLHEYTSEEDFDRWARVDDCSDGFEWCEFVPAQQPAAVDGAYPTRSGPPAHGGCERCSRCREGDFARCKNRQYAYLAAQQGGDT